MYKKFNQCQEVLAEVKPVNFFLANQLMNTLRVNSVEEQYHEVIYHLLLALGEALSEGHTCLSLKNLSGQRLWTSSQEECADDNCIGYQFGCEQTLISAIESLSLISGEHPVVFENNRLYLRKYWVFENEVAYSLNTKIDTSHEIDIDKAQSILAQLFSQPSVEALDHQRLAVANALNKDFIVIAGGPGTGKTTTVAKLLVSLQRLHHNALRIGMAAPTGKAAQRLNESLLGSKAKIAQFCDVDNDCLDSIPTNASTIQRLLGVKRDSHNFNHDSENLLELDVLLIDEISMIDLPMMARVLRAVPAHCRVILLGDADQLASVEVGSILADIAPRLHEGYSASNVEYLHALTGENIQVNPQGIDHLSLLTFSHRFKGDGGIGKLAKSVITGDVNTSWELVKQGDNEITPVANQHFDDWIASLVDLQFSQIFRSEDHESAFAIMNQFKVLSALKQGEYGVEGINSKVEKILSDKGVIRGSTGWYKGRPIMITKNDYRLELFNGDIGLLWPDASGKLFAVFPTSQDENGVQQYRWLTPARLPSFETVYAMTIHKTQGSEFEQLAIVLPDKDLPLLTRELLYTGITRAKRKLAFYGNKQVFITGVTKQIVRHSGLKERIHNSYSVMNIER